jgi:hypothetical protein
MLVYFICNILLPFGVFYGNSVMYWKFALFFPLWYYIVSKKSGNPVRSRTLKVALFSLLFKSCKTLRLGKFTEKIGHA